ncbi:MAG: filamentous hemagglutinin N-terminal domain-containing protein [Xanthomonadaceae bacterium]|nr:filamentous hemagglutinin N-terminal domain-containing protein [Xanthomonadaceae bacterium]
MSTNMTNRKQLNGLRRRRLASALVAALAVPAMPALAQSLPDAGTVVSGNASIENAGTTMLITQTTKGAIINWGDFSIGYGYGVTFDQQFGAGSVTLNRVIGGGYGISPSFIEGNITANGSVFLINPAGVSFTSSAVVNVGSLVASTIDLSDDNFNYGVATGHYQFDPMTATGDQSITVNMGAQINTTAAGTVALLGRQVLNQGDITTPGGSVLFGSAESVTLDFQGDGLTMLTIQGPGIAKPGSFGCPMMPCPGPVNPALINTGTITADGGQILMRTAMTAGGAGGMIIAGGTLRARSLATRSGRVELTTDSVAILGAPGVLTDTGTDFTAGVIDIDGGAYKGGSVLIQGNQITLVNNADTTNGIPATVGSSIRADGAAGGGSIQLQSATTVTLNPLSWLSANGVSGAGGDIQITAAGGISLYGELSASSKGASGGNILLDAGTGTLSLDGNVTAVGSVNGGRITATGYDLLLAPGYSINASGGAGAGGSIALTAANYLAAYGQLRARGGSAGGAIVTRSGGLFDLRGLQVDAGATGTAGSWTLDAPSLTVVHGSAIGNPDAPVYGTNLQDAEINNAFYNGTSVILNSNADVQLSNAQILSSNAANLAFTVNAAGGISGTGFSIAGSNGALGMVFNANSAGGSPNAGGIDFSSGSLVSMGGNISMYGQSDPANGFASSAGNGIALAGMTVNSGGGNMLLRGSSTGSRGSSAGVLVANSTLNAGSGGMSIYGNGGGPASGVRINGSNLAVGLQGIRIEGHSTNADGLIAQASGVMVAGGNIDLIGTGAGIGVFFDGGLSSGGGAIRVHGEGGSGGGTTVTGAIASAGGLIDVFGSSLGASGLVLGGSGYGGVTSGGGNILLQGQGATGGVILNRGKISGNTVDSAGGSLTVLGTASGAGAVGTAIDGLTLQSASGALSVTGNAAQGVGITFANGAGVSTTTGAIGLHGTGATFGLDVANGAIQTNSGNITLDGTATAVNAVAGVRVTGNGLTTNGGTIRVTGTSAGGVGVQLGDGSNPFVIGSGGGAITLSGTGVNAGVLMQNNQVTTGGGALAITGSGGALGVSMMGGSVNSGGGNLDVNGTASASGGVGVDLDASLAAAAGAVRVQGIAASGSGLRFGPASGISTTTGGISLTGVGADSGMTIAGGTFTTSSGHIDLRGRSTAANSDGLVIGNGVSISSNGGGIALSGEGSNAGLRLGSGAVVDAGNSLIILRAANTGAGDALVLDGNLRSGLGVNLRPGGVDANGSLYDRVDDQILLGSGNGFALSNAELARISAPEIVVGSNQHAGTILVQEAITRNGNLTLQNGGGSGGINLQSGIDVGNYTLALSSGGSIIQSASAALHAHSLLASAGGDVLLGTAQNDVASTTLAGSAGGNFQFTDVNALAVGTVSATGFNAGTGQLSSMGASGVTAGGDVLIRNLAGDLTLNADVRGVNIDLVTAGRLQNPAGAQLFASGDWRVWASSWNGETRGGLAGDGALPNLYGCAYLGACGVSVGTGDNHFIYVQQPVATITFGNATREYGLDNPAFTYLVTGAILGDTAGGIVSGTASSVGTKGSDVGNYAIAGNFTSPAGYILQLVPGVLSITPATLVFTADPFVRYLGSANPLFSGTVTGFRNGDTQQSVFGTGAVWSSPAGALSPVGYYPIVGGTSAKNYVFVQAPGNATALQVIPLPQLSSTPVDFIRETVDTYVYDRNFGSAPVCAVNASMADQQLASAGDGLANEWSKVRSRPNLTNCFDSERRTSCGDF